MSRSKLVRPLVFALLLMLTPFAYGQAQLAGDWTGTLNTGPNPMHIAWHVKAAADGTVTSAFDNLDEQVFGIKVKTLNLDGSKVMAAVDDNIQVNGQEAHVQGNLEGTLSKDGNEVTGTWTQTEPTQPPVDFVFKRQQATSASAAGSTPAAAAPAASASAKLAGDWKGSLSVQGMEPHLLFHFRATPDGALAGTFDSVDQGANGIPLNSVELKDSKLRITIDAVHGTYEGTVNADASGIKGTWTQTQPLELNLVRATPEPAAAAAAPSDIDGTWAGAIDAGGTQMRMLVKIVNTSQGLKAQLSSPDQGPGWAPASSTQRTGSTFTAEWKAFQVTYEGKISPDLQAIDGTFTQAGNSVPLALKRSKD